MHLYADFSIGITFKTYTHQHFQKIFIDQNFVKKRIFQKLKNKDSTKELGFFFIKDISSLTRNSGHHRF